MLLVIGIPERGMRGMVLVAFSRTVSASARDQTAVWLLVGAYVRPDIGEPVGQTAIRCGPESPESRGSEGRREQADGQSPEPISAWRVHAASVRSF